MTRAILFSAAVIAFGAAPALAADLPVKARPMVPVVTVYNWSGCYIGGNGGGKWARTSDAVTIGGPTTFGTTTITGGTLDFGSTTSSTWLLGGQIGCNWQAPGSNWVFGVEGDADAQRWSATRTIGVLPAGFGATGFIPGDNFDIRSNWEASLRGRIGYAWDRWMLYATGGVAFTGVRAGANWITTTVGATVFPATITTDSKTLVGPTAGIGLEYAFSNNWSFGVEGRWAWYGSQTFNGGQLAVVAPTTTTFLFAPTTQSIKVETLEITGRLNYKFDWGGPVVARY